MRNRTYSFVVAVLFLVSILTLPCFARNLQIQCNTKTYGGVNGGHDPEDNVAVLFITKPDTSFINTVMVWSYYGFDFMMKNWRTWSGLGKIAMYDGETKATRGDHKDTLKATWDCKDTSGTQVPDGTYLFWVEMQESDYFWGDFDPNEKYLGRIACGSIVVDNTAKEANGDMTDTVFFNFKAIYDPTTGIVVSAEKHISNKTFLHRFDPLTQNLTIKLNSNYEKNLVLHVMNPKGKLLKAIKCISQSQEISWNLQNISGKRVPSGIYLFEIRSLQNNKRVGKAFPIAIIR